MPLGLFEPSDEVLDAEVGTPGRRTRTTNDGRWRPSLHWPAKLGNPPSSGRSHACCAARTSPRSSHRVSGQTLTALARELTGSDICQLQEVWRPPSGRRHSRIHHRHVEGAARHRHGQRGFSTFNSGAGWSFISRCPGPNAN